MNHYIQYLRKSIDNKKGKKKIINDKKEAVYEYPCEAILGLNGKVQEFAAFFEKYEDDLLIFVTAKLQQWCSENSFTKEELDIYKLALTEVPTFFLECVLERDKKVKEEIERHQALAQQAADGV